MLSILGYATFALGAFLSLLNFYFSFVRVPMLRACGRSTRFVSGFPLIGSSLLVATAAILWGTRPLVLSALVIAALDTGGIHWFLGVLLVAAIRARLRGRNAA
jgi:hypothetical protein